LDYNVKKSVVYIDVNVDTRHAMTLNTPKMANEIIKKWQYPPSYLLNVNVLLSFLVYNYVVS